MPTWLLLDVIIPPTYLPTYLPSTYLLLLGTTTTTTTTGTTTALTSITLDEARSKLNVEAEVEVVEVEVLFFCWKLEAQVFKHNDGNNTNATSDKYVQKFMHNNYYLQISSYKYIQHIIIQ